MARNGASWPYGMGGQLGRSRKLAIMFAMRTHGCAMTSKEDRTPEEKEYVAGLEKGLAIIEA
jgi:hypothetical protein